MVQKQTDRVKQATDRLIYQYAETSTTKAITEALNLDSQDKEDTAIDCIDLRWLDSSEGKQLDEFGAILDVSRQGRSDAEYRTRILAAIIRYQSAGDYSSIVSAFKLLTNLQGVQLVENFPAGIILSGEYTGTEPPDVPEADLAAVMNGARAAGVSLDAVLSAGSPAFAFSEYEGVAGGFYDDANPGGGGHLSLILFGSLGG